MDRTDQLPDEGGSVEPGRAFEPLEAAEGEGTALPGGPAGDGADTQATAETEIWVGRTRWQHYAGRIGLWFAANVALAFFVGWITSQLDELQASHGFWIIVAVVLVSGFVVVGPVLFTIISQRYRLTSQRLFVERGILSQTIDQTELIRVDDVRIHKSLADRLFGLGTVSILSTDVTDREVVISGISGPESVAEHIRSRMRAMRKKSLFVENL